LIQHLITIDADFCIYPSPGRGVVAFDDSGFEVGAFGLLSDCGEGWAVVGFSDVAV